MYSIKKKVHVHLVHTYNMIAVCMENDMLLAHTRKLPAALMGKFVMICGPLSGNIYTPNGNNVNGYQRTNTYEETIERG